MSDLISRQEACQKMQELYEEDCERFGVPIPDCFDYERAIEALEEIPTIDIVRCGECKWFDRREGCFFSTAEIDSACFCSFGERRER